MLDGATARECTLTGAGAKAAAEPKRAKERTEKSFIVAMFGLFIGLLVFSTAIEEKSDERWRMRTKISLPHRLCGVTNSYVVVKERRGNEVAEEQTDLSTLFSTLHFLSSPFDTKEERKKKWKWMNEVVKRIPYYLLLWAGRLLNPLISWQPNGYLKVMDKYAANTLFCFEPYNTFSSRKTGYLTSCCLNFQRTQSRLTKTKIHCSSHSNHMT